MQIPKDQIISMIEQRLGGDQAQQAAQQLPDQVDHEQHGGLLSQFGINPQELLGQSGGGGGGYQDPGQGQQYGGQGDQYGGGGAGYQDPGQDEQYGGGGGYQDAGQGEQYGGGGGGGGYQDPGQGGGYQEQGEQSY